MTPEQELEEVQEEIETLKKELARAEGATTQIFRDLADKYQCSTTKEAKNLLKVLESEAEALRKKRDKELQEYRDEYQSRIEGTAEDAG